MRWKKNRYSLSIENGQLTGTGATILKTALSQSQFILIGEDHGIAQIPELWTAICGVAVPAGFHTMAIETGPLATMQLQQWIRQPDGESQLARFEKDHPDSIAFYNMKQEFEMLQQCGRQDRAGAFRLFGLDQEFLGSASWVLEQILQRKLGAQSRSAIEDLLKKAAAARSKAEKSGSPADLYLMAANQDDLNRAASALKTDGSPHSQPLFAGLVQSHDIYAAFMRGANYQSNRTRAQLMKTTFARDYAKATGKTQDSPKMLIKMGTNHLYRGRNPLHSSEIGDYVSELAEGQGRRSLHILILGVKGSQLHYTKVGAPYEPGALDLTQDQSFEYMRPMFDQLLTTGWTIFDLRPLRDDFGSLGATGEDVERLVFGYDILILIPNVTASSQIR